MFPITCLFIYISSPSFDHSDNFLIVYIKAKTAQIDYLYNVEYEWFASLLSFYFFRKNMCFSIEAKGFSFCILCLTFLYTTLTVYADPDKLCPPSELIEPCTCPSPTCIASWCVHVVCQDINEQEPLTRVFTGDFKFGYFTIKHASVLYLPDSLFEVRGLNELIVEDSTFITLFNHTTTTDNSINFMALNKLQILRGFDWKMVSGFHRLNRLEIRQTKVSKVDQSFIDHAPKSLEVLQIENCSMTTIHDRAFAGLPNLKTVIVRWGKIKELKRSMFATPSYIKGLDFRWEIS